MDADFPAAHSMDSQWFAVDRAGHVGYFRTGENGAMPLNVLGGLEAEEVETRLRESVSPTKTVFVLAGRRLPNSVSGRKHVEISRDVPVRGVLVFLESIEPLREEIDARRALVVPASQDVAVILQGVSWEVVHRLHRSGACRGCFSEVYPLPHFSRPSLSRHGIFCFDAFDWSGLACPYGLRERPEHPLHVDELPPDLRGQVRRLELSLLLPETLHIQPVEHVPCWATGPVVYLDAAGTTIRPLSGWEDSYRDDVEELRAFFTEYQVELPSSASEDPPC